MEAGDAERVATLYLRILKHKDNASPSPSLVHYIRSFYCDGAFRELDIPSLVHLADDGRLTGFVGVHCVPILWKGQRLRAAYCGSLMVENHSADPLAGAALLKAFLGGPQDLSVSETASPVAQAMWERLRGHVLVSHSLDWIRILRPAGFTLAVAARKWPALGAAKPLARAADRLVGGRASKSSLARLPPETAQAGLTLDTVGLEAFAALVRQFSNTYALAPDWSEGYCEHVLTEALDKVEYGAPVMAAVKVRGTVLGAVLFHEAPSGVRRVLQLLGPPERTGLMLQCLFADALAKGAAGVRGRADPRILQAAPGRHMALAAVASTVVHARNAELLAALRSGDVLVNGLAGESWCRLFGNAFR